jgi:hypothetical protein
LYVLIANIDTFKIPICVLITNNMYSNFKKTVKHGSEKGMFGKDVEEHLYKLQKETIDAKHDGWASGNPYFLQDVEEADSKRLITKGLKARFLALNKAANKALHPK